MTLSLHCLLVALVIAACGVVSEMVVLGHGGVSMALLRDGILSSEEGCVFSSLAGNVAPTRWCNDSSPQALWLV